MAETAHRKRRALWSWRYVRTERRRAYRLAFILFWSIVVYFAFTGYVASMGVIVNRSMHPTLSEGSYYWVNRYTYRFAPPRRGDIVVFRRPGDPSREYVKRVIGLPEETVLVRSGAVSINGRRLTEPYAVGATDGDLGPLALGRDTYFVLGDNRMESEDSRHFGAIPLRDITGKIDPGMPFPYR